MTARVDLQFRMQNYHAIPAGRSRLELKPSLTSILGLVLAIASLLGAGCKDESAQVDKAFQHTPENTHRNIQELRLQLVEALKQKDLQYIHDNMFYLQGLLQALSNGLTGQKKEEVDAVVRRLIAVSNALDNSAGRKNFAATEVNLKKLIDELTALEALFKQ